MEISELNQLIQLLDNPSALTKKMEELKSQQINDESVAGFIILYDVYKGDVQEIKNQLTKSKFQITQSARLNKVQKFAYLKYAAILILLFGTGYSLFLVTNNSNKTELKDQFNEPGLANYMSAKSTTSWEDIMFDYKMKSYNQALKKINSSLINSKFNDTLYYFKAVIYYELKKYNQSSEEFNKVISKSSVFKDKANYYLGKIEYRKGNKKSAVSIFKSLTQSKDLDIKNASSEHVNELK